MSAAAPSRAASREDGRTELVRLRALSRALLERTRQLEGALESRDRPGGVALDGVEQAAGATGVHDGLRVIDRLGDPKRLLGVVDRLGELAAPAQAPDQRRPRVDGWRHGLAESLERQVARE